MLATLYFSHIIIPMEQQNNNLKNLEHLDFLLYAKLAHLEDMIEIATDDAEKLLVDIRSFKESKL
jgi:hypothetical protein